MQIITTHKNTDFDALASTICATLLYPGAVPVVPKNVNPNVKQFLSIHKKVFNVQYPGDVDPDKVTRLIVVDTNSWHRLERLDVLKDRIDLEIFLWDHHAMPGDIRPDWECVEEAGATITLMVRKLRKLGTPITPIQATLFLAGLYEDTGNMMFPSTGVEDAKALAFLLEAGADLNLLSAFIRTAYGRKQKDILFDMLQSADRIRISGYNVSINKVDISGHVDNLGAVMNMYREIVDVDAAFGLFSPNGAKVMVIGRSGNIEGLDVGAVMRKLGGGGHPAAGSALVKSVPPEEIEKQIIGLIDGNIQPAVRIGDIMSFPVHWVPPDMTMKKAAIVLRKKGCTGLPVIDGDTLVGMISRSDFRKLRKNSAMEAPVKAFMKTNVITVSPGLNPLQASRLMVKHDIGRLPVVEDDKVIGILTRSDTMSYFYNLMPE